MMQSDLEKLTLQYSQLEKAYGNLLNRDEFITDLLTQLLASETLVKNLQEDSIKKITALSAELEALKSRSLWNCICGK